MHIKIKSGGGNYIPLRIYIAYPLGFKGVVVGQGDTCEAVLADINSSIKFHIETFGEDVFEIDSPQWGFLIMNVAVQAQLPENLVKQAESFVNEGWAANLSDLMTEALRRYLETHQSEFIEQFIRDDISWGLNGRD